ncbi:lysine--tRNA ligase [Morganella morganii]|uniref:lysine--tRNA ligase n=1 Tax=Morganella morganii TaxID=582 RepID=UPI000D1F616E|nr:lysine--tRNA ligase [Morganella morganii]HAE78337.1 lysine--tRNA ligase [Morganella sp. (in: enterobacteria)]QXO43468.1 lysine--tRNA ligase [Morganella morganii]QXO47060.1 lysine--tRNA ligase [Morganella morganii]QXO50829.1 lysine--tRNA ligase [Morganella morganii]QXO54695.1 lysine--tRNA ligase [Morganella morganii]
MNDISSVDSTNELNVRREKLAAIRKSQPIAFPNNFKRENVSVDLHREYDGAEQSELEKQNIHVVVAGRIMTKRIMGKASFINVRDNKGLIQIYVSQDVISEDSYNEFKKFDIGDIVGIKGTLFKTKTGELSVNCQDIELLTKSLRPLPDKFHGLTDQEMRYRQRYVDLIVNEESYTTFLLRSRILAEIRRYMVEHDFMEVETPMMQLIPGGASARPFTTHHNALDVDMYLRISPELFLKRLVVGGFERVFEINRNFRNEGISPRHNPEFTMMELYMAYADYNDLILLTEDLFRTVAVNVLGTPVVDYGDEVFDFGKPFNKLTMREAIIKYGDNITMEDIIDYDKASRVAQKLGITIEPSWGLGRLQSEIFEEVAEHHLVQPTFITEYPAEISPLARRSDENPMYTDRFEFFIGKREIGNGFSELNDAEDQAERFNDQVKAKDAGDDEAMFYDEDYVTALEYGMPPTAGLGIGIDRMIMLFTNSHTIRDVILFPTLKPVE